MVKSLKGLGRTTEHPGGLIVFNNKGAKQTEIPITASSITTS